MQGYMHKRVNVSRKNLNKVNLDNQVSDYAKPITSS